MKKITLTCAITALAATLSFSGAHAKHGNDDSERYCAGTNAGEYCTDRYYPCWRVAQKYGSECYDRHRYSAEETQ